MPFIQEKTIFKLISKIRKDVDCIVYAWSKEKYEPMCAIYKKSVFYDSKENTSFHELIGAMKNKILIPINKQTKTFFNINTKNDLILAEKLIKA